MSSLLKLASKSTLKTSNALFVSSFKCSTGAPAGAYLQYDRDPAAQFLNPQTQKLLKSMTRLRLEKVYQKRAIADNKVEYKFMTTEQIEAEIKNAIVKANKLLQMPPIVKIQEETPKVIATAPALTNFDKSKYIFTDITFAIPDNQRTIVVRHPDGTLDHACAEIRKRMNQIYFPREGRSLRQPRLFQPENLIPCLDQSNYEFVLDRACTQYEPYEEEFHNVTQQVYQHINESKQFDLLRSTRHFGPMCFFLAWHRIIDNLLIDMIRRDFLHNGIELICLMYQLNGAKYDVGILDKVEKLSRKRAETLDQSVLAIGRGELQQDIDEKVGKSAEDFAIDDVCYEFIETYNKAAAIKKTQIEAISQRSREMSYEKRRLLEGLHKAHGLS